MPCEVFSDMRFQNRRSESLAASRPPIVNPCASTTALTAPALDAVMPSKEMRSSSSRRSSTPQVKAPWLPPPWRPRLTVLVPACAALARVVSTLWSTKLPFENGPGPAAVVSNTEPAVPVPACCMRGARNRRAGRALPRCHARTRRYFGKGNPVGEREAADRRRFVALDRRFQRFMRDRTAASRSFHASRLGHSADDGSFLVRNEIRSATVTAGDGGDALLLRQRTAPADVV